MRSCWSRWIASLAAFLVVAVMFPAASRAFAPVARRMIVVGTTTRPRPNYDVVAANGATRVLQRQMGTTTTTTESGEYKTVVEICSERIKEALETDIVEVKGAFHLHI